MIAHEQILKFVAEELATASAIKTAEELIAEPTHTLFGDLHFTSEHAMMVAASIEEEFDLDYLDPGDIMGCRDLATVVALVEEKLGTQAAIDEAAPGPSSEIAATNAPAASSDDVEDMDADAVAALFPEFGN
ncbi:MAG: hypothetical protein LBI64_00415 [Coriobacteriales bacterium]|jgi:acyl carrier protein|nr:hypothetical protein [Coriobacteriales bacterium]